MTFNPAIPQTGTRIDQTYNLITTNFSESNTIFGNDHYAFNDANVARRGRHKHVFFPGNSPGFPTVGAGQSLLTSVNAELVQWKEGTLASDATYVTWEKNPIWKGNVNTTSAAPPGGDTGLVVYTSNSNGIAIKLPNGVVMQWGSVNTGIANVTFPTTFPTAALSIQLTVSGNVNGTATAIVRASTLTTSSFDLLITTSVAYSKIYWFAIGN